MYINILFQTQTYLEDFIMQDLKIDKNQCFHPICLSVIKKNHLHWTPQISNLVAVLPKFKPPYFAFTLPVKPWKNYFPITPTPLGR